MSAAPAKTPRTRLLASLSIVLAILGVHASAAAAVPIQLADDLADVVARGTVPAGTTWAVNANGTHHVKVLVVADGSDPEMTALRAAIVAGGGSVYARYYSVSAVSALLPLNRVAAIAARPDVTSISPNRRTSRTASLLESATGTVSASATSPRTYVGGAMSGLDGRGVGIAVLDSGIASAHAAFADGAGASRVSKSVDLVRVGQGISFMGSMQSLLSFGGTNVTPVDTSNSLEPGSDQRAFYESWIKGRGSDTYGHGTHVASIAAGRGGFALRPTTDPTGIAPGATLYDVKVLDGQGQGRSATRSPASTG